ncbi:MAG: hypothetical protein PHC68_09020 [Syntrophorhabdaceae bacterium]|nr:hypothetical protein [Syntrophorhabdaceae bacterium]
MLRVIIADDHPVVLKGLKEIGPNISDPDPCRKKDDRIFMDIRV